ncbi:MAG: hypothetical protein LW826_01995 [Candidatus Jidaibacter sp.]|nr:hypothetical protein [Candidatus Jidaibacter sp.]
MSLSKSHYIADFPSIFKPSLSIANVAFMHSIVCSIVIAHSNGLLLSIVRPLLKAKRIGSTPYILCCEDAAHLIASIPRIGKECVYAYSHASRPLIVLLF